MNKCEIDNILDLYEHLVLKIAQLPDDFNLTESQKVRFIALDNLTHLLDTKYNFSEKSAQWYKEIFMLGN